MWTPILRGPRTTFRSSPTGRRPAARPVCAKFPFGARNHPSARRCAKERRCHRWRGVRAGVCKSCVPPPPRHGRRSCVCATLVRLSSLSVSLVYVSHTRRVHTVRMWPVVGGPLSWLYIVSGVCVFESLLCVRACMHVCLSYRMCVCVNNCSAGRKRANVE